MYLMSTLLPLFYKFNQLTNTFKVLVLVKYVIILSRYLVSESQWRLGGQGESLRLWSVKSMLTVGAVDQTRPA